MVESEGMRVIRASKDADELLNNMTGYTRDGSIVNVEDGVVGLKGDKVTQLTTDIVKRYLIKAEKALMPEIIAKAIELSSKDMIEMSQELVRHLGTIIASADSKLEPPEIDFRIYGYREDSILVCPKCLSRMVFEGDQMSVLQRPLATHDIDGKIICTKCHNQSVLGFYRSAVLPRAMVLACGSVGESGLIRCSKGIVVLNVTQNYPLTEDDNGTFFQCQSTCTKDCTKHLQLKITAG